jgi:hypothetical protein
MTPTDLATRIAEDYRKWEGRIGPYIGHEARKLGVSGNSIRMVLRIVGVLSASEPKSHRYRGSTEKASPGAIIVTDGKTVTVNLRSTAEPCTANWQGVVDQATTCHLATVITPTESAAAVAKAYDGAVEFLGRAPAAFIHDQKPIHDDERLHMHIEPGTLMIPATLGRGQNKAGMEGEFGRYEKQVGAITIDDRTKQSLVETIVHEVVRAYQAGINHAGRVEFDGKSRVEIVRQACPDPKRDAELVAKLKATHPRGRRPADPLPTAGIVRTLLDDAFVRLTLVMDDTSRLRAWLAATFEPEAVRRALALLETKRAKGGIQGPYAHRYLVKLIQSHQSEINIERAVQSMLHYAEIESAAWLTNLQIEHTRLLAESSPGDYLNRLADKALCGNIVIENAFWEKALEEALASAPAQFTAVMVHIRRLYEVPEFRRLGLINRVMTHRAGLGRVPN